MACKVSWRCWDFRFLKFRPQNFFLGKIRSKKLTFSLKIGTFPTLNPFLSKFGPKKSKLFILPKSWHTHTHTHTHTQSTSMVLILFLILVFSKYKPKSRGCCFLFWDWFSKIPILNPFFGQIWAKKVEFPTLPESWYTEYREDVIVRLQWKVWKQR